MNRIFDFFNKIMGLAVFLIAVTLVISLFHHGHHRGKWHHSHFSNGMGGRDSVMKSNRDSADKKIVTPLN